MSKVRSGFKFLCGTFDLNLKLKMSFVAHFPVQQLSESEQSEGEADTKEKKAAPPSGRKYVPPKIAAVHYGNVSLLFRREATSCCLHGGLLIRSTNKLTPPVH